MEDMKILEEMKEIVREIAPKAFDLYCSCVHNRIMEKRMENAKQLIETVNKGLKEYGLQVDYEKYFEEKLAVPIEAVRTASELEKTEQRELLQKLFMRHLAGEYEDDGYYVSFIRIIKELTSEDIRELMKIRDGEESDWRSEEVNHLFHFGFVDVYHDIEVPDIREDTRIVIDGGEAEESSVRNYIPLQRAVQAGKPYLTRLGESFIKACVEPLREKEEA